MCPANTVACGVPTRMYSCNSATGDCAASSSGTYDSLESCNSACTIGNRYECDSSSGTCSSDPSGTYATLTECESYCSLPDNKYSCTNGVCATSASGNYDSLSACK